MNNINRVILGDTSAVRDKGLSYLHQNYFWPVSDDDFSDFSRFLYDEYMDLVKNENNIEISNIATVEFSFIAQLLQIFHYNYVREYSSEKRFELIVGKESQEFLNPNWNSIKHYYSRLSYPYSDIVRMIRRFVRNIVFNKHLSFIQIFNGLLFGSDEISVGSNDSLKKDFISNQNKFFDHVDWPYLMKSDTVVPDKKILEYRNYFVNNIIDPYLQKLKECDSLFVKNIDFDNIKNVWSTRISEAYLLYLNLKSSSVSSKLLITEISKPINKLITVAYQSKGCEVYGFNHGHESAIKISKLVFSTNIAQCRNLIVPTNGTKARYQKHYSKTCGVMEVSTRFISVHSKRMYKIYLKNIENKLNDDINTIMIMGYPCNSNRYLCSKGLFFYQQLDLEYQIISILKEKNKRIIYKAHPERLSEIKGLFDHLVDDIVVDSFENVWQKADLLIFTYSETTTFGYALTTNLPIVLLDAEKDMRDLDDMKLLDKRVVRICTEVNRNTQINFNKKTLIRAITQSNYEISYDYVEAVYK